jgi:LysM repeat protein
MRRITPKLFFLAILSVLMVILSACNLPAVQDKNISITQTAFSEKVKIAGTPTLPLITDTPSPTPTSTPSLPPTPVTPTIGPRPSYYTLQPGEFPYCIARRFNIDPGELLSLNRLSSWAVYDAGLTLTIPQTGHIFPSTRALLRHPASYVVPEQQMSVYKIACLFGDVDPLEIVRVNNLPSYYVNYGVTLQIP